MADDQTELRIFLIDGGQAGGSPGTSSSTAAGGAFTPPPGTPPPPPASAVSAAAQAMSLGDVGGLLKGAGGVGGSLGNILGGADSLMSGAGGAVATAAGALAVIKPAADLAAGAFRGAAQAVQTFADVMSRGIGSADAIGAVRALGDAGWGAAKGLAEAVPLIGGMLRAQGDFLEGLGNLPRRAMDAFLERGRQLQGLSGDIAGARALADARSLLADLNEAQQLGPGIGRLTTAQSELNDLLRSLLLPIKRVLVDVLARWVERGVGVLESLEPFLAGLSRAAEKLILAADAFAAADIPGGAKDVGMAFREIVEAIRLWKADRDKQEKDALKGLYNVFENRLLPGFQQ